MLLFAVTLIAADPTPAVALPYQPRPLASSPNCPRTTTYHAWQSGKVPKPEKLADLPPANVYLAVLRRVRGCEVPVVVKYGVGRP